MSTTTSTATTTTSALTQLRHDGDRKIAQNTSFDVFWAIDMFFLDLLSLITYISNYVATAVNYLATACRDDGRKAQYTSNNVSWAIGMFFI
jgi:hypothetical protein